MPLFYIETGMGACIRSAEDQNQAYHQVLKEVGSYNGVQVVREATEDDVAWVKAMGGIIPD